MTEISGWLGVLSAGFEVTLKLAALTSVFAIALATFITFVGINPWRWGNLFASAYVEVFRSIPILALLVFVYYGLGPLVNRLGVSSFWLAVVSLTLIEAAYLAEIYRAALLSVRAEQWSAGASLGLDWWSTLRLVILPQALPSGLPGTANMLIAIVKDSSLASLVAVNEITLAATQLVSLTFQPLPVYALLSLYYLALLIPFSFLARLVEKAVARLIGTDVGRNESGPARSLLGRMVAGLGRWT